MALQAMLKIDFIHNKAFSGLKGLHAIAQAEAEARGLGYL